MVLYPAAYTSVFFFYDIAVSPVVRDPFGYCAVYRVPATKNRIRQSRIVRPLDIVYQWRTIIYPSEFDITSSVSSTLSTVRVPFAYPVLVMPILPESKKSKLFFSSFSAFCRNALFFSLLLNVSTPSDVPTRCSSCTPYDL